MGKTYRNSSKTVRGPKRPFESDRLDAELKLIGQFGLKNKREVWRTSTALAKLRARARYLLTLDPTHHDRLFQGPALLSKLKQFGLLSDAEYQLDYVLGLTVEKLLSRRLQTIVHRHGLAQSIHQARVLIRQGHVRVGKQVVNSPSLMLKLTSEKHIDYATTSPLGSGRPGRNARRTLRNNKE